MRKILITAGATAEPIDDVRYLTNISTGSTGIQLAQLLAAAGNSSQLLLSTTSTAGNSTTNIPTTHFTSTENLRQLLQQKLSTGEFDTVIHCAAVSDYRPENPHNGKIPSDEKSLTLTLVPTPKLLPLLKNFSAKPLTVVGFKLTSNATSTGTSTAVAKLFASKTVDLVIHNDLSTRALQGDSRPFNIYANGNSTTPLATINGISTLAAWLNQNLPEPTLAQKPRTS